MDRLDPEDSLTIRVAHEFDAYDVAQIYIAAWNSGFVGLMPLRQVDTGLVERWRRELAAPLTRRWWVAEVAGVISGFAGIGPSRDPIAPALGELDTIAVAPRMWRHGIGRALMAEALRFLIIDGYREAVVWTLADYPQGQGFYESQGWSRDGVTRDDGRQVCYRRLLNS